MIIIPGDYSPTEKKPFSYIEYLANHKMKFLFDVIKTDLEELLIKSNDVEFTLDYRGCYDDGEPYIENYDLRKDLSNLLLRYRELTKEHIRSLFETDIEGRRYNYWTTKLKSLRNIAVKNGNDIVENECVSLELICSNIQKAMKGDLVIPEYNIQAKKTETQEGIEYIKLREGHEAEDLANRIFRAEGFGSIMDATKEQLQSIFEGKLLTDNQILWKLKTGRTGSNGIKYLIEFFQLISKGNVIYELADHVRDIVIINSFKHENGIYDKESISDSLKRKSSGNDKYEKQMTEFLKSAGINIP